MKVSEPPKCPHCGETMKKWRTPEHSTWTAPYHWVCFNDGCPYYKRGWEVMMERQNVKASYRQRIDPETGAGGPLPCWSEDAHKDHIIEE